MLRLIFFIWLAFGYLGLIVANRLDLAHLNPSECPNTPNNINELAAASAFWHNDLMKAFTGACNILRLSKKKEGVLRSLSKAMTSGSDPLIKLPQNHIGHVDVPKQRNQIIIRSWEILGPLPVGKLEVDGDPSFENAPSHNQLFVDPNECSGNDEGSIATSWDSASHILGMDPDTSVYSEMMSGGEVRWLPTKGDKASGTVNINFPAMQWNELAHGTSSFAAFEFQGWARATTYVTESGQYAVHCPGVHSVYIRNNGVSHLVVGDIYRGGLVQDSVGLTTGPVGIALPLRGAGGAQFSCRLDYIPSQDTLMAKVLGGSRLLSNLIQLPLGATSLTNINLDSQSGLLISPYFSIILENPYEKAINITLRLRHLAKEIPGLGGDLSVRIATDPSFPSAQWEANSNTIVIEAGQVMSVPLELCVVNQQASSVIPWKGLALPCEVHQQQLQLIISNSESPHSPAPPAASSIPLEFTCRNSDQSFVLSYLDHDGSIAETAVVFPLVPDARLKKDAKPSAYPVLLSLHGTGISPMNQADAYKQMNPGDSDYTFGVEGFWTVAPSRHGAHNWEAVGALSADTSVRSVQKFMSRVLDLPQLSLVNGVIAGHSMGGHGAWMNAVSHPDFSLCVSATSSWTRKEEYGDSNRFFDLDVSKSYIHPKVKFLLESSMSEFHVDSLVRNIRGKDVHIRVGAKDRTTHPWYSRRMRRLLATHNINVSYEEVPNKEHWWWDTAVSNDGGVLNDPEMRNFYRTCSQKSTLESEPLSCAVKLDGSPLSLDVINPATHMGACGVRIVQQFQAMQLSSVDVSCGGSEMKARECILRTNGNVRRLSVSLSTDSYLGGVTYIYIEQSRIGPIKDILSNNNDSIDICWKRKKSSGSDAYACTETMDNLQEKTLASAGSVRQVYSKPFVIVYGTFQIDSSEATILREMAIYHANAHHAAHHTSVRVLSDETYLSSMHRMMPHNVVFIGARENRAMRDLCLGAAVEGGAHPIGLQCRSPVQFSFLSESIPSKNSFSFGHMYYSGADDGIIFTLPLSGRGALYEGWSGIGLCIAANSPAGYNYISRLSWPVVPPMVRSPLANYFPDFTVVNKEVWAQGFGAVKAIGNWNSTWGFCDRQSYVSR